jgi:AcrR family transcriptional regulator
MTAIPRRELMRAKPLQSRSVSTVEAILEAATAVLLKDGVTGFNTNAVAAAAGVNIGTLYHYFQNKEAILIALYEQREAERSAFVLKMIDEMPGSRPPREVIRVMIERLLRQRRAYPAWSMLRHACLGNPKLRAIDETSTETHAVNLAARICGRFPAIDPERARTASRLLIAVTFGALDRVTRHPEDGDLMVEELVRLVCAYLGDLTGLTQILGVAARPDAAA